MDQSAPKPGFTKPIGGFIVVLFTALVIGGWLYVDGVKNELEMKVDGLSSELEAAKLANGGDAEGKKMAPLAEEEKKGWQTYAGALGEYRFQIDLPPTHHLSVGEEATSAYVVLNPTPENESAVPDMGIDLLDVTSQTYLSLKGKDDARSRLVLTADGKAAFWIHVWEDFEWSEAAEVLASFKAL